MVHPTIIYLYILTFPDSTIDQLEQSLEITDCPAYNYHNNYYPQNACDGNTATFYAAKDNDFTVNWIKFNLNGTHEIGTVTIIPRNNWGRIMNTAVYVYYNESSVAHCGTITELLSGYWPNDLNYHIDCNGVSGDMIYLTDLDTTACCGLMIAEVEIYQFIAGISR